MTSPHRIYSFLIALGISCLSGLALALEESNAAHHGNAGPSMSTLFSGINFLILILLLFFLLKKPLKEYFLSRAALMRQAVEEAQKTYSQALKQSEEVKARLQNLEKETAVLLHSFEEEAEAERQTLARQASVAATRIKEDAQKIADTELKKAKEELRELAVTLSKELAEKMVKEEMKEEDQARLTRSYIDRLRRLH